MLRFVVTAGWILCASTALAQFTQNNSGGSTGYGAFGNRTIGGGTNSGTSGFSSGMSSSTGSSGMNSSGIGGNSMGSGSVGGSQLGGSPTQGFQLGSSLSSAQQRSTAGFIGADNSDAANARSMQAQQNQMSSLQNVFSQFSRQNQQRNQNQNQNRNQQNDKKQLRISIKADIPLVTSATAPTSLGRVFEARLKKLPGLEKGNSIQVSMQGRTAVLTGSVASDRDRKLAQGLALLEPGISAVQNELVVADAASTGEELPAPRR